MFMFWYQTNACHLSNQCSTTFYVIFMICLWLFLKTSKKEKKKEQRWKSLFCLIFEKLHFLFSLYNNNQCYDFIRHLSTSFFGSNAWFLSNVHIILLFWNHLSSTSLKFVMTNSLDYLLCKYVFLHLKLHMIIFFVNSFGTYLTKTSKQSYSCTISHIHTTYRKAQWIFSFCYSEKQMVLIVLTNRVNQASGV